MYVLLGYMFLYHLSTVQGMLRKMAYNTYTAIAFMYIAIGTSTAISIYANIILVIV